MMMLLFSLSLMRFMMIPEYLKSKSDAYLPSSSERNRMSFYMSDDYLFRHPFEKNVMGKRMTFHEKGYFSVATCIRL